MTTATASETRYMNYQAAARYSGMSEMTLRRLVEADRLRVYRPTHSKYKAARQHFEAGAGQR